MDLKMEVYSPALELLGLLEVHSSVIWERKAFSAGSFSLNSLITEETRVLLVPENIIWIEGDTAGVIEYIREEAGENGPYISVKGYDLTGILNRRILWGRYDLSGTVPDVMRQLVDDCCIHPTRGDAIARVIPGLVLEDAYAGGGASVRIQKTGGSLLAALEDLGDAYQISFGVRFNPQVPRMEFWVRPGENLSVQQNKNEPVFFSTELDDVLSSVYAYDSGNYKNVSLVAGEGEGNNRVYVTVVGEAEQTVHTGFIPANSDVVMLTADGQTFTVRAAADEPYKSVYTGQQIDTAIGKALAGGGGGTGGVTMQQVNSAIQAAVLDSWEGLY